MMALKGDRSQVAALKPVGLAISKWRHGSQFFNDGGHDRYDLLNIIFGSETRKAKADGTVKDGVRQSHRCQYMGGIERAGGTGGA